MSTPDPLGAGRALVVARLNAAGIRTADHGAPFTPPGVIILAADPWLVRGETFGSWRLRLDVHAVAGKALTRPAILALEKLVGQVAEVLPDIVTEFGPPTADTFGDSTYLTATATALIDI